MKTKRTVVVLVHGTWGRGFIPWLLRAEAGWCAAGSDCRRTIEARLGGDVIAIPFAWSGGNSSSARWVASRDLQKILVAFASDDNYETAIHLVAHSHGGNVAMYAAHGIERHISSLTCFSTPFLNFIPRDTSERAISNLTATVGGTLGLLFWPVLLIVLKLLGSNLDLSERLAPLDLAIGEDAAALVKIFFLVIAFALPVAAIAKLFGGTLRKQLKVVERLQLPACPSYRTLLIRAAGDEAGEGIGMLRLGTSLMTRAILISRKLSVFPGCLFVIVPIMLAALAWLWYLFVNDKELALFLVVAGVMAFIVHARRYASALAYLLCTVFFLAAAALTYGFDGDLALTSMCYQITAEATPLGRWSIALVPPASETFQSAFALSHGTHSSAGALAEFSTWLSLHFPQSGEA